jgi:hypothetical protein
VYQRARVNMHGHGRRDRTRILRLMGLPNVARYPEATVTRDETSVLIRFSGPYYGEQEMSVPLQYVGGDAEEAELRLLAQLQQIGYTVRREEGNLPDQ